MQREPTYLLPISDGSGEIDLLSGHSLQSESIFLHMLQPNMSNLDLQMMMYTQLRVSNELLLRSLIYGGNKRECGSGHKGVVKW